MAQNFPQDYADWQTTDFKNLYDAFAKWCNGTPLPTPLPFFNADCKKLYDLLIIC